MFSCAVTLTSASCLLLKLSDVDTNLKRGGTGALASMAKKHDAAVKVETIMDTLASYLAVEDPVKHN